MDATILTKVFGLSAGAAQKWIDPLVQTMGKFHISDNKLRIAAFLAQVGHESGRFIYTAELWGPTVMQQRYERNFGAAWPPVPKDPRNQKAYDLGNDMAGDGRKFKGHGLIQVTGKSNHVKCGISLGLDLLNNPDLLTVPLNAALSAGWFWDAHGLNYLADQKMFLAITHRINGGELGQQQRQTYYDALLEVL